MSFSVVRAIPEDEWRQFVNRSPMGNIFHTPEIYTVFQNTKGYLPELWAVRGDDRRLLALFLPVQITLKQGLMKMLTTQTVAYGSLLWEQSREGRDGLKTLLSSYQKKSKSKSLFTELRNCCPMDDIQPVLEHQRFDFEDHLNYIISLDGTPEFVFNNIGKRTQRNIKRGLKHGRVAVEEITDHTGIASAYELLNKTYHLAQVPLADRSLFEAAFDELYLKGMMRATLAKVDGTAVATSFELVYKDTIYGWYGGMDREYSSYNPNEMLMWDVLRWGAEKGFKRYDFGGAGKPNEEYGVRDFKAKFGGTLVNYGRFKWAPNLLLLRISTLGYQVFRKFL